MPELKAKYLGYTKDIAQKWLDWKRLGPIAEKHHALILDAVRHDTRKLSSTEAFEKSLHENVGGGTGFGRGTKIGIKNFADMRRAYLLGYEEKKPASPEKSSER